EGQDRGRSMSGAQMDKHARQKRALLHKDEALLDQAGFAVEMPQVLVGSFDGKYLTLPKEVLMTTMKEHQGYFSLVGKDGKLLPNFIAVVNVRVSEAVLRSGKQRVW